MGRWKESCRQCTENRHLWGNRHHSRQRIYPTGFSSIHSLLLSSLHSFLFRSLQIFLYYSLSLILSSRTGVSFSQVSPTSVWLKVTDVTRVNHSLLTFITPFSERDLYFFLTHPLSIFPLPSCNWGEQKRERDGGGKDAEFNDNVSSQLIIHFLFLIPSSLSFSFNTFIERECLCY